MTPWKVLKSETLLEHPWLTIREQAVALGNGNVIEAFHLVESPDWTGVVALTEDQEVILVEQYRHGYGRVSVELPAGVVDRGEEPLAAAKRELLEETGYVADAWQPLLSVCVEPSRNTNRAHFFFARGARRIQEPKLDPGEDLAVRLVSASALLEALDDQSVAHGVHVGAILMAVRRGWL